MSDASSPAAGAGAPATYSEGYKRVVLGLLLAAYTFNFIDRTIIATIGQAIKVDLKLDDTQLGLLGGLYFALLYTILGIPIARLAERYSRVNIIAVSIVIWSGFTALCGTAANFATLALYRFGVGVGEAGCSPPAHSLISDYFEPKKRASALAVYSFGIPLGTMFGAVAGGWLAQNLSWRMAFILVGLPGILVAIAIKLFIKEPVRGGADTAAVQARAASDKAAAGTNRGLKGEFSEIWAVTKILFGRPAVLHIVLGVTLASFASYGSGHFTPPFYIRNFGVSLAEVGMIVGLIAGVSAGLGTLVGGFLSDRLGARSPRWYALTPAIGLGLSAPLYVIAFSQDSWDKTAMWLIVPGILHYLYLAPTFGVIQNMVEVRRRATATAILFFFLNLIALGGGPPFTGWVIDHLGAFNFANPGQGLMAGLGGMFGADTAAFKAACPGGVGSTACTDAVALATRQGIIVTVCIYGWAALHYFLASFGLVKELAKARADRGEA
jgi:MFS family permease